MISLIGCGNTGSAGNSESSSSNTTSQQISQDTEAVEDAEVADVTSEEASSIPDFANIQINDTVFFGTYNGKPLEWIVLDHKDGKTFLVTKCGLFEPYGFNDEYDQNANWANCTLRAWMNDTFYNSLFSDEEKEVVVLSHISTPGASADIWGERPESEIERYPWAEACDDTDDYIFLLSAEEAREYLGVKPDYEYPEGYCVQPSYDFFVIEDENGNRITVDSQVKEQYGLPHRECMDLSGSPCNYVLRSPGKYAGSITIVGTRFSTDIDNSHICNIRPAIWVYD